jgi:cytochrome c-type biogenesis protein CcsB
VNRRAARWFLVLGACATAQAPRTTEGAEAGVEALRRIPVLAGGRFKPLDSYAREVVTAVTGEESPKLVGADGAERRVDPLSVYLEWVFDPATARRRPLIAAPDAEARALVAPGRGEKSVRFSYDELAADADFFAVVAAALERPSETWSNAERELLLVRKRWAEFAENAGLPSDGRPTDPSLRGGPPCVPPRGGREPGVEYRWGRVSDARAFGHAPELAGAVESAWTDLGAAWRAGAPDAVATAVARFSTAVAALGATEGPTPEALAREVRYHRTAPFSVAAALYFAAFWLGVVRLAVRKPRIAFAAAAVAVVGLGFHVFGSIERTALSGQALIGNLFESLLFVGGVAVLAGLIFELRFRSGWLLAAGALLGWVALRAALDHPLFMPPGIARLRPVLINNFWIHIHVPTIMAAYATLGLSAVLSHVWLVLRLFRDETHPELRAVARVSARVVPAGVILLFAGIVLGGIWADASWGRFWGWDPKETWSLVTWLVYLVVLHGRFTGKLGDGGAAVGGLIGGLSLLMTYYGVNFFLTGLHSYAGASADGAGFPVWLTAWLTFEAALLTAVGVRRRRAAAIGAGRAAPARIACTEGPPRHA